VGVPKNTLTLVLSGEVLLEELTNGLTSFQSLIDALGREVAAGAVIDWRVEDLAPGSARASVRGIARREDDQPKVEQVVEAYARVGAALEAGRPVPYSGSVAKAAERLVLLIGDRIDSIILETEDQDWTISRPGEGINSPVEGLPLEPAYGAVEGRVQTLSSRGGLRFTLYDTLFDKAVSCYLAEGYEEIMRGTWGRMAVVEGMVKRDPRTGRPLTVRDVRSVEPLEEGGREDYRRARGLVAIGPDAPLPEEVIRKARDG
jgi:hypothetical protein